MAPWDGIFFLDEMGWAALFERKPDADSFTFYCQHHIWEGEPKLCFQPFHSLTGNWDTDVDLELQFKNMLGILAPVLAIDVLKWVSVSGPVRLISVIKLSKDKYKEALVK